MKTWIIPAALMGGLAASASSTPAYAGCHLIDCVENVYIKPAQLKKHSCESLWILRNSIFDDAGYCFQSARGLKWFSNDGCKFSDQDEVPLNGYQRANVDVLMDAEAEKGC
jgi:hypothetical protein